MAGFNVTGFWEAHQGNGFVVNFDVTQTGTELEGSASHSGGQVQGTVEGSVRGNVFLASVRWGNGTRGDTTGHLTASGGSRVLRLTKNIRQVRQPG